ncbi:LysR family transcriptional regulator [Haloferula sargassicola]|uniref:HTH-type transcriptional regulator CatM n=1 Tax=Haloferula sargassicola TaxID=490096 RepID=A0ABP9UNQ1_9BACT
MDSKLVRAFLAVVDAGSITAAARKLGLTQPALSRRIQALEEELGVPLLERGAHSVSISPAGRVLERDGRKWLAMGAQVRQRVVSAGLGESLRVGYSPSLAGDLLGPALERFSQLHPRVRVQLSDLSTAEMKDALKEGDLDLIVTVPDPSDGAGIHWEPVLQRELRLAVSLGHRLAKLDRVAVSELAEESLLMFAREGYPDYWRRVGAFFAEQGISPRVVGEFDGLSSLSMAVQAGIGVALMADRGPDRSLPGLTLLSLHPDPQPICVSAGWRNEPQAPARVLIEELKRSAAGG